MTDPVSIKILKRRDTSDNWTANNPILAAGEEGYELNTGKSKVGDGATAWVDLPYFNIPEGETGTSIGYNVPDNGNAGVNELVLGSDTRLTNSRTPTGAAGGVLSGSYPNPGFAQDMATQSELEAEVTARSSADSDLQTQVNSKAAASHTHTIANVTGLQTALDGKADDSEITTLTNAVAGKEDAGTAASAVTTHNADTTDVHGITDTSALVVTTDPRLSDARTPTAHTHPISDVTGLQAELDSLQTSIDNHDSLPPLGTSGQVLTVSSGATPVAEWADAAGAVESVNGQTGVVVLDYSDVGALQNVLGASGDIVYQPGMAATDHMDTATLSSPAGAAWWQDRYLTNIQDGNTATVWRRENAVSMDAYVDFGSAKEVGLFRANFGWTDGQTFPCIVEYATDDPGVNNANNVTWTEACRVSGVNTAGIWYSAAVSPSVTARWWRIKTIVADIQPAEYELRPPSSPQALPVGTGGQILTVSGGLPVWADNLFTSAKDTKLTGIEAGADVTDATNVDAAGAVMNSDTTTAAMSFVVDEDDMASNSATKVPTQQSVKAYVDGAVGDPLPTLGTPGQVLTVSSDATPTAVWADAGAAAVDSVNGQTGVVVLDPDDLDDSATTNKFTSSADISKLAGIETSADVTDATNVAAAGAVMASSGIVVVDAGTDLSTARPTAAVVYWKFDAGTDVGTNGASVVNGQVGDIYFVAAA